MGFFSQQEKIVTPLYSDLFEQMCLASGCCLFLTGSYLTETDNLRALILQMLPHGGKHLEELVLIRRRRGLGGLSPKWQHSGRMGVLRI